MKPSFNRRKATSFGLLVSFTILFVSGAILWILPRTTGFGSVPEFGGLTKPAWLDQHFVFGILFTLLSCYHLFGFNREPLFSYLKKSPGAQGAHRPELMTTLLATALIAMITALHNPSISGTLKPGNEIASAVEAHDAQYDEPYEQSAEFSGHHRHHANDDNDGRYASPQLAWRQDAAGENEAAQSFTDNAANRATASNGAPDDELHRRTTASCASCH